MDKNKQAIRIAQITLLLVLVAAIAGFFVPVAKGFDPLLYRITMSFTFTAAVFYIGAAILLTGGLAKFKSKIKRAYGIVVAGMIFLAGTQFLIGAATAFQQWQERWVESAQAFFYFGSILSLYIGMRLFSRLLQIKSLSTSVFFALGTAALFIGAVIALLLGVQELTGKQLKVVLIVPMGLLIWLLIISAWMALQVRRQASQWYRSSMLWLSVGFAILAGGLSLLIANILILDTSRDWTVSKTFALLPYVLSGAALLTGAYKFYRIGRTGIVELPQAENLTTSIDIVVYAASLASVPTAVDPWLDGVREVTATTGGGDLTAAQQEKLKSIYLKIEDYLINEEPARSYERDYVRDFITRKLAARKQQVPTFWPQLAESAKRPVGGAADNQASVTT